MVTAKNIMLPRWVAWLPCHTLCLYNLIPSENPKHFSEWHVASTLEKWREMVNLANTVLWSSETGTRSAVWNQDNLFFCIKIFIFSITIHIQYCIYITFRCPAQCLVIYIIYEVIPPSFIQSCGTSHSYYNIINYYSWSCTLHFCDYPVTKITLPFSPSRWSWVSVSLYLKG